MSLDRFRLDGKVAIVTGSTRGIGLATARLMAQAGARVVISSRKPEACEQVCAQLQAEGLAVLGIACHVGREDDRRRLIEQTLQQCGRLDVLVANAAVNPSFEPLAGIAPETWTKVLDTNLTAPLQLAQLALPAIAAQGGGAMVLVSSITGVLAVPNSGAYAISKAAENHLARQLAAEWGSRNIRINAVAPGTTRTDMIRALMDQPGAEQRAIDETVLQRLAEPEDIAATILFLASGAARHITGQVLTVDGGQTLGLGRNAQAP